MVKWVNNMGKQVKQYKKIGKTTQKKTWIISTEQGKIRKWDAIYNTMGDGVGKTEGKHWNNI